MNKRLIYNHQKGFTLTEVLVAMVILSTAIVSLLTLVTQNLRITSETEQRFVASLVADNVLAETMAPATLPDNLTSAGEVELASQTWRWRRELDETVIPGLYRVRVTVRLEDSEQILGSIVAFREGA